MVPTIQSLKSSLAVLGKDSLLSYLEKFKCEKDEDIEKFLRTIALDYEEKGICRTFFIMSEEHPGKILGYFAIGLNVMHFDEAIQVEDAYEGVNIHENGYRPIFKLYMIGKDDNFKDVFKMDNIFNDIVLTCFKNAQAIIGGDLLYIDCDPVLRDYYSKLGFEYYDEDPKNKLIRMIRAL
jgi:hypothetical protein